MPLYTYQCEECTHTQDVFYRMDDKRPESMLCDKCEGKAIRLFNIGAAFLKKKRVGDIWDEAEVDPRRDAERAKQNNSERIRKLREQSKINAERNRNMRNGKK